MENEPQFLKDFSKEESQEERDLVAQEIKAKRAEHFDTKKEKTERHQELAEGNSEQQELLDKRFESLQTLEEEIEDLSTNGLKRLVNYFKLKNCRAEIINGKKEHKELEELQKSPQEEEMKLYNELNPEETPEEFKEAENMLDKFYKGEREKWSDFSKEDIINDFSEKHLASLSLKEYGSLLRRFPDKMVTHVVRQGIRDHVGMQYHSGGRGEYSDSFKKIIKDGRLRSPLSVSVIENGKEKAIKKILEIDEAENKEEAHDKLEDFISEEFAGYPDSAALHFATEEVADELYGAEKGNEIFIAYPSAHIASQYYFYGDLTDGGGGGSQKNDQWVYANEERGMDLNAGIIFIPKEAKVGKNSGSQYELDKENKPTVNKDYMDKVLAVFESKDFEDFGNKIRDDFFSDSFKEEDLIPFREKLKKEFNIIDQDLQDAILDIKSIRDWTPRASEWDLNEKAQECLERKGIFHIKAKDTISSEEYWKNYFSKDPDNKPSKIVYYEGEDPTEALDEWKRKNVDILLEKSEYKTGARNVDQKKELEREKRNRKISELKDKKKNRKRVDEEFAENNIKPLEHPEVIERASRFKSIAEKIINEHFSMEESKLTKT